MSENTEYGWLDPRPMPGEVAVLRARIAELEADLRGITEAGTDGLWAERARDKARLAAVIAICDDPYAHTDGYGFTIDRVRAAATGGTE